MAGWIKAHRKMIEWEWFQDSKTFHCFMYLLMKASHNDYNFRGVSLQKGQLPFGLHKASKETGVSVQSWRTIIKRLKSTNEITIKPSTQGSVITILNWNEYQHPTNESTINQQTINKRSTTTKNGKKVKNKKNSSSGNMTQLVEDYGQERYDAAVIKAEEYGKTKKINNKAKLIEKILREDYTPVPKLERELGELLENN